MNKIIVDSGKVVKRLLVKAGRLDALVCTQSFFEDNEALIHDSSIDELFLLDLPTLEASQDIEFIKASWP